MFVRGGGDTPTPFGGLTLCTGTLTHRLATAQTGTGIGTCGTNPIGIINHSISKSEIASFGLAPGTTLSMAFIYRDPNASGTNFMGATPTMVFTMLP
jgi:hypothetical protein